MSESNHPPSDPWPEGFGITLVANASSSVGLGLTARNIAGVLGRHGVPFSILDVPHSWGTRELEPSLAAHLVGGMDRLSHPISLYVLPMVFLESLFENNPGLLAKGRMHIANLWWEASRIPESWIPNLSRFDAVLAMSRFIAELAANSLPLTPVILGEHPLALPGNAGPDRAGWDFPEEATVFVSSLDPNSDPVRKNPGDLVRAFQRAFPAGNEAVRLLIRLNNADTDLGRAVAAQLQKLAMGDARIRLLLAPMSYPEVISLYASADVFVSLHRGEGLGLGLMEAMALGKPVIATGWSGNMSFMNQSNSCLVRYRLTEVSGHWDFFKPAFIGTEARWAVPVLEDAVSWMRALHADKALCNRIGTNARVHALAYQVRAFEASWIGELAAMYCVQALLPRAVRKYSNTGRQ